MAPLALALALACAKGQEADRKASNGTNEQVQASASKSTSGSSVESASPFAGAGPLANSGVLPLLRQARAFVESGRLEQAERILRRARDQAPKQPEVALLLGQVLMQRSKIEMGYSTTDLDLAHEGLALIEEVAAFRSDDLDTALVLGRAYLLAKDRDSARAVFEKVLRRVPGNRRAARMLGGLFFEQGEAQEAEKVLRPLVTPQTKDANLLALWGMVLEDQDRFEEALHAYRRAVVLAPFERKARFKVASVLATLGREQEADQALAEYGELLARKARAKGLERKAAGADNPSMQWVQAGLARLNLEDSMLALEDFQQAVSADPSNAQALQLLGQLLASRGVLLEAKKALEESVRLAPNAPQARCSLGAILLSMGDASAAIEQLEIASKQAQSLPAGDQQRALCERAEKLLDSARKNSGANEPGANEPGANEPGANEQ